MKVIFLDNGVTGSIGVYDGEASRFLLTPVVKMQDYTKAKKTISRIDVVALSRFFREEFSDSVRVVIERPLINPARFSASISAARALEATLAVVEGQHLPYMFCDSKEWQRGILPSSGKKGITSDVLKKESMDIGIRLFPTYGELIRKHKDADGILGAYAFWKRESGGGR